MRAMSPRSAEVLVARTMRALALTFAVVGVLFVAWPDGTLHRLDQVGNWFGGVAHAPKAHEKALVGPAVSGIIVITRDAPGLPTHGGRPPPVAAGPPPGEARA